MSEFDGRPFVAGSLIGLRSFRVDSLGRLTGVRHPSVWRPGVNDAECQKGSGSGGWYSISFASLLGGGGGGGGSVSVDLAPKSESVSLVKAPPHRPGQLGCSCGYYAYFDRGHNPHHEEGNLLALVEGYGTVTIGSRGFRAGKARVVGLIDERRRRSGLPLDALAARFYNRGPATSGIGLAMLTFGIIFLSTFASEGRAWALAFAPLVILGALVTYLSFRSIAVHYKPAPRPRRSLDLVRGNYPDVPVYSSLAAALAEHPLTAPPPPTPDTDPDFWTRAVS